MTYIRWSVHIFMTVWYRMGPPRSLSCLISGLTMVYGRYNELINGGFVMVYKPSYNWGAPSCRMSDVYHGQLWLRRWCCVTLSGNWKCSEKPCKRNSSTVVKYLNAGPNSTAKPLESLEIMPGRKHQTHFWSWYHSFIFHCQRVSKTMRTA